MMANAAKMELRLPHHHAGKHVAPMAVGTE